MSVDLTITGEKAWAVLGMSVLAYEILTTEEHLLSVAVDRFITAQPVFTRVCIGLLALHLANAIPQRVDPIHIIASKANAYGGKTLRLRLKRV